MGASLGTGNLGVSALGASLIGLVRGNANGKVSMLLGRHTGAPFRLIQNGHELSVPVLNYRRSPRASFREQLFVWFGLACLYRALPLASWRTFLRRQHPLIRASAEAHLIGDIRGGDSFSDIYGLKHFLLGSLEVIAVVLVRGRIVLFPQTYGPYKFAIARAVARFILRRASVIFSRDRESMSTVTQLIGEPNRCQFCPDVAFSLEARPPDQLLIEPPLQNSPLLIGLNVNGLMFNGGYTRKNMFGLKLDYPAFLVRLVERLLAEPDRQLLLVPHTFAPPTSVQSDLAACGKVRDQLPAALQARVHIVAGEYDESQIKAVIGKCVFLIGSRMHACIAALSQGIPAVGVAYSKKFRGVFETVGAEDSVIDGRELNVQEAVDRALHLYADREQLRARLAVTVPAAQARLRSAFAELMGPDTAPEPVNNASTPVAAVAPKSKYSVVRGR